MTFVQFNGRTIGGRGVDCGLPWNFRNVQTETLPTFGIVMVHVPRNKVDLYRALASELLDAVARVRPGEVVRGWPSLNST